MGKVCLLEVWFLWRWKCFSLGGLALNIFLNLFLKQTFVMCLNDMENIDRNYIKFKWNSFSHIYLIFSLPKKWFQHCTIIAIMKYKLSLFKILLQLLRIWAWQVTESNCSLRIPVVSQGGRLESQNGVTQKCWDAAYFLGKFSIVWCCSTLGLRADHPKICLDGALILLS